MKKNHRGLLCATIAYADIFQYPLTLAEVDEWFIGEKYTLELAESSKLPDALTAKMGYICLAGRDNLVEVRKQRAIFCMSKWQHAENAAMLLALVPSVRLVGVTGGLAMNNADADDDIDLYIIASRGTVWITRFFVTVFLAFTGSRRMPRAHAVKDKICLNMFVGEGSLSVPIPERDIYSAHEVLQMKPLWTRGNVYQRYLTSNSWVRKYLPNKWALVHTITYPESAIRWWHRVGSWIMQIFERPAEMCQKWYMRNRITSEIVSDTIIRFHPNDARRWVKRAFALRLSRLRIPLDNMA